MPDDVDSWFMGGNAPTLKFPVPGTTYEGVIVHRAMQQRTEYKTRKPQFFDDGAPKMQAVLTLQTDLRDPELERDDGQRRLFVSYRMREAIAEAIRESGAKTIAQGGKLKIQFNKYGESEGPNPPKIFRARYTPPAEGDWDDDDFGPPVQNPPQAVRFEEGHTNATDAVPTPPIETCPEDDEPF